MFLAERCLPRPTNGSEKRSFVTNALRASVLRYRGFVEEKDFRKAGFSFMGQCGSDCKKTV